MKGSSILLPLPLLSCLICFSWSVAEFRAHPPTTPPRPNADTWQPEGMDSIEARASYLKAKIRIAKSPSFTIDQLVQNDTQVLLIGENHSENEDYYPTLLKYLKEHHGATCLLMEYPDGFNSLLHGYQNGQIDKKTFDAGLELHGYSPLSKDLLRSAKDLSMTVDFIDAFTQGKVPTSRFRLRNEYMTDAVEKKTSICKFAVAIVGASHLIDEAGYTGIDSLLRRRGVKVKSIRVLRVPTRNGEPVHSTMPQGFTKSPYHLPSSSDGGYFLGDFPKGFEVPPNYGTENNWLTSPPKTAIGFTTTLEKGKTVPTASSVRDSSVEENRWRAYHWDTFDAVLVIPKQTSDSP